MAELLKWDVSGRDSKPDDKPPQVGHHSRARRKSKSQQKNFKENPYFVFLDAVSGEEEEGEGDSPGVMGGLQSWLGFAGSLGGNEVTNLSSVNIHPAKRPWLKNEKSNEEGMSKKAEEHMSKIAGDFCTWLRGLPGEDRTINNMTESHLRSLFDTGQDKSGEAVVEKELEAGSETKVVVSSVSGEEVPGPSERSSSRHRRQFYGSWYLRPADWGTRYRRRIDTSAGTVSLDQTGVKLGACLPGQVDMMGGQQPVCQLHSTKVSLTVGSAAY